MVEPSVKMLSVLYFVDFSSYGLHRQLMFFASFENLLIQLFPNMFSSLC